MAHWLVNHPAVWRALNRCLSPLGLALYLNRRVVEREEGGWTYREAVGRPFLRLALAQHKPEVL